MNQIWQLDHVINEADRADGTWHNGHWAPDAHTHWWIAPGGHSPLFPHSIQAGRAPR